MPDDLSAIGFSTLVAAHLADIVNNVRIDLGHAWASLVIIALMPLPTRAFAVQVCGVLLQRLVASFPRCR